LSITNKGKKIEKGVVRRRSRIVVHSKQKNKFIKKTNKGDMRILLGSKHNQAMPFGMVGG